MFANFFRDQKIERAGVSFLFGDAELAEDVNDRFRLDFQLARQLVDADLIRIRHKPLSGLLPRAPQLQQRETPPKVFLEFRLRFRELRLIGLPVRMFCQEMPRQQ